MAVSEDLLEKIRLRREAKAAEEQARVSRIASEDFSQYASLIPEAEYDRTEEDVKLDTVLASIDIITAYKKWIGKSQVNPNDRRREGIKVSCPVPGHRDTNPSAWLNTDKNVWFCAACDMGGDIYDLAAFYHGYPVPGYKEGATFHELRRVIASDFGYSFISIPGTNEYAIMAPGAEGSPENAANSGEEAAVSPSVAPVSTLSVVPALPDDIDEESEGALVAMYLGEGSGIMPELDWRTIIPSGTFLRKYMEITSEDDVVEEFHFWNAMTSLGFTVGRNTVLFDRVPVMANLFICTLGDSGSGKSQAKYHMTNLIDAALKFDPMDMNPQGVKFIGTPGSAESLINQFEHKVYDPTKPKSVLFSAPVKGLIEFNELSALTGRAARMGNVLKPTLMDFYDGAAVISTSSMTSGLKEARGAFASCHTTTQPKAIGKLLNQGDSDSGFLNRWFFAGGVPKERVAIGGKTIDMGPAVIPLQLVRDHYSGSAQTIPWSDPAARMFEEFFRDVLVPLKSRDDSGLLVRLDLFYKKLILLFTLNIMANEVPVEAVQTALAMHQYIVACYAIPSDKLGDTALSTVHRDIAEFVKHQETKGKNPSIGEISKAMARKKHQLDLVKKTIDLMVFMGELHQIAATAGRGRPTVRFSYAG